jgi:hypothetical protein
MQIQNSQSLSQHLASGGSLTLGKQGQLETQSAAGRLFQKIGDAFRSITSSGRAAIETRNANLNTAMANMLRRDTLVNPARNEIPSSAAPSRADSFAARFGMTQGLRKFPRELRSAARNLGQQLLRLPGVLGQGGPAETRAKVLEVMNKIRHDPVVFNALRYDYARSQTQLKPLLPEIGDGLRAIFMDQKDRYINQDGIHANYLSDAERDLDSINGRKPDTADLVNELKDLVPDQKIRGFLSMVPTQTGLIGALYSQFQASGKTRDNPDMPDLAELLGKGLQTHTLDHHYDMVVEGGKARVKLEMDTVIKPASGLQNVAGALGIDFDGAVADTEGRHLGGGRYTIEIEVDLNQDMTGKDIPDFELVNASRVPLPAQPPAG